MQDLFHAGGYANCEFNIARAGREIDLRGVHRVEGRQAIAECKATKKPQGGDAINKFVGALDAERRAARQAAGRERPCTGYFVSLGGFTATAVAQEEEFDGQRIVLLGPAEVEAELIAGRIVVSEAKAAAEAGRVVRDQSLKFLPPSELMAWKDGWVRAMYFGASGRKTHFVLVHADGYVLEQEVSGELVAADASVGGRLENLKILNPPDDALAADAAAAEALDAYRAYIQNEYGSIAIDGLPTDQEVGSRRIALDDLYVPLHLDAIGTDSDAEADVVEIDDLQGDIDPRFEADSEEDPEVRNPVAAVLARHRNVAILGLPGSGKSTLLKHLSVRYARAGSSRAEADGLPAEDLLPLVIRCRQLGASAQLSVRGALNEIPERAELSDHAAGFETLIGRALRSGTALLLVDGLDEIAADSDRVGFVKQLRTFMATYPTTRVVITSREAGFRVVAGALGDVCEQYRLSAFDETDIEQLTVSWHRLVTGEGERIEVQARALAESILQTDRVRTLAVNPLLLTTLLLVRRWVGELPRKRTVLYQKAIEVLLMTWNVEGHEPLDMDEAIPQLAYLAHHMTLAGKQALPAPEIKRVLAEARQQMPEILSYSQQTPAAFLDRVEERSSLLSLSGHELLDGALTPVFEFKHLTFQEYLTAVACVEGFVPGGESDGLVETLRSHFSDVGWREVIPLAAVLSGRRAGAVVEALCTQVEQEALDAAKRDEDADRRSSRSPAALPASLARVLGDEPPLAPPLVDRVCMALINNTPWNTFHGRELEAVVSSRYGQTFCTALGAKYHAAEATFWVCSSLYADVTFAEANGKFGLGGRVDQARIAAFVERMFDGGTPAEVTRGSLVLMINAFAFGNRTSRQAEIGWMSQHLGTLLEGLTSDDRSRVHASAWALAWMLPSRRIEPGEHSGALADALLGVWRGSDDEVGSVAAWAFGTLPLKVQPSGSCLSAYSDLDAWLRGQWESGPNPLHGREDRRIAALTLAVAIGKPWRDSELAEMAAELHRGEASFPVVAALRRPAEG